MATDEGNLRYYYFGVSSNFRRFNFGHAVAVRKLNPFENNRLYGITFCHVSLAAKCLSSGHTIEYWNMIPVSQTCFPSCRCVLSCRAVAEAVRGIAPRTPPENLYSDALLLSG